MRAWRNIFVSLAVLLLTARGAEPRWPPPARGVPRRASAATSGGAVKGAPTEDVAVQAEALLALSREQHPTDHALAVETARRALALFQSLSDTAGAARAHAQLGQYHMALSDLPEAVQNYEQALRLWQELNRPQEQAGALVMLGFIEARKGETSNTIAYLGQAFDLIKESDEPALKGRIANGLAHVFRESGLPEEALPKYEEALTYFRQTQSARDISLTLQAIGVAHYLRDRHAEAITHLQQALAGFDPSSLEAALCYQSLGTVYLALREHDEALRHLNLALPIYESRGNNPKEAAKVRALLGQVYEQQGQVERARRTYREALKTFDRLSDRVNQAAVHYALGKLELGQSNYDAAEEHLRRSVEATEDIRRVPASSDLTAAFSAAVYERYEKYVECLMRRHEAQPSGGYDRRAFGASELARARSLSELLRATQTSLLPGLDPELAAQEKLLRQTLRAKEDRRVALLAAANKEAELAQLDAELAQLEAAFRRLTDNIRSSHPAFEQLTRPAAWDLPRIQEQVVVDDQTVLLEYALGEGRSHVWAVTRDGFRSYVLPARGQIDEAADKVYQTLSAKSRRGADEEFGPAAQELARMVLAPVAAELNRRRVIVVADGALNYIPFQALPSPSAGGEPLVAAHEVINAPSATILGELRDEAARRRPPPKVLAAFGNPALASDPARRKGAGGGGGALAAAQQLSLARLRQALRDIEPEGSRFDPAAVPPLFFAKRELANLREEAGGGETFVAAEYDATRERLLGTDLTQYSILHFATHGFFNPKRPESSGLLFSTLDADGRELDGFVGLQDVYAMRAPVDLVVLSACYTGLGKDVRGEGLLGLTRGFMYAGASGVVASLWQVDDEATAELMKQFYANLLRGGRTPAAALREAQNSIRQRPEWRSPYYWAAFTLQGEHGRVIKPAPAARATQTYLKAAACGALLLLLAAAGVWYRRRRPRRVPAGG